MAVSRGEKKGTYLSNFPEKANVSATKLDRQSLPLRKGKRNSSVRRIKEKDGERTKIHVGKGTQLLQKKVLGGENGTEVKRVKDEGKGRKT